MSTNQKAHPMRGHVPDPAEDLLLGDALDDPAHFVSNLHSRYSGLVFGVAYRITGSASDAQDVVQNVFLKLPASLRSFDLRRPIAPWIKRLAARAALDLARTTRRRSDRERRADHGREDVQDVEEAILARVALRAALDRLPAEMRAIIVLKEIEGYTNAEIAEMLQITPANAAVRLHRAWKRLLKHVDR